MVLLFARVITVNVALSPEFRAGITRRTMRAAVFGSALPRSTVALVRSSAAEKVSVRRILLVGSAPLLVIRRVKVKTAPTLACDGLTALCRISPWAAAVAVAGARVGATVARRVGVAVLFTVAVEVAGARVAVEAGVRVDSPLPLVGEGLGVRVDSPLPLVGEGLGVRVSVVVRVGVAEVVAC